MKFCTSAEIIYLDKINSNIEIWWIDPLQVKVSNQGHLGIWFYWTLPLYKYILWSYDDYFVSLSLQYVLNDMSLQSQVIFDPSLCMRDEV